MKKICFPIFFSVLLVLTSNAWSHGGMGGGMGGMGGFGNGLGDLINSMMGGTRDRMTDQGRTRDHGYQDAERLQRENRIYRQHYETTRDIRRAMDQTQEAIDRESHRDNPDNKKLSGLHEELDELRHELDLEQQRFERYIQDYYRNED